MLERFDQLIEKGLSVLVTHRPNPSNLSGFPTLDAGAFAEWRAQALACLGSVQRDNRVYLQSFESQVKQAKQNAVKTGLGILRAAREDLAKGRIGGEPEQAPLMLLNQICTYFHAVVRQLRLRHCGRVTLDVQDEYDVQDLMHALLLLHFTDVRPEESTPSLAGKASRMDFLLKLEAIVVEAKMTRSGLGAKELSAQLIEDIERYKAHPDCKALVCFVYDPDGRVANPRGIESDLNRDDGPYIVRIFIRPD